MSYLLRNDGTAIPGWSGPDDAGKAEWDRMAEKAGSLRGRAFDAARIRGCFSAQHSHPWPLTEVAAAINRVIGDPGSGGGGLLTESEAEKLVERFEATCREAKRVLSLRLLRELGAVPDDPSDPYGDRQ